MAKKLVRLFGSEWEFIITILKAQQSNKDTAWDDYIKKIIDKINNQLDMQRMSKKYIRELR